MGRDTILIWGVFLVNSTIKKKSSNNYEVIKVLNRNINKDKVRNTWAIP